jgi:DNA modification methylase
VEDEVKPTLWHNCYDSSWKGLIAEASFAHPAKFARGLIERIYDHCLAKGYLKRGDLVADVFGGIGTGGITAAYRGLNWIGCELEPKFVGFAYDNFQLHRRHWETMRLPTPWMLSGDSRKFDEHVAGIVSSPPYAESLRGVEHNGIDCAKLAKPNPGRNSQAASSEGYGASNGQIGSLKSGAVEAVISSPPFATQQTGGGLAKPDAKYSSAKHGNFGPEHFGRFGKNHGYQNQGDSDGNIASLKEGTVAGVISSPPYSDIAAGAGGLNTKPAKKLGQQCGRNPGAASQSGNWSKEIQRYGTATGQISQLKGGSVDGVVSSPPFENSLAQVSKSGVKPPHDSTKLLEHNYGNSEGQIGKETGETYWQAVDAVYRACFRCIRPGGVVVLVVKDYCAKGKRVRLCDDTLRLLEHIGFVPLERIHAMLVTETVENGLFGEERTKRQRKSFFRRLYEAKLPEEDERRIDHEEVLICRRP